MLVTLFASSTSLRHRLNAVVTGWQRLFQIASDPYRPERHYMRGPGPKWHAKQRGQHGAR
jgi:hypothetical protein